MLYAIAAPALIWLGVQNGYAITALVVCLWLVVLRSRFGLPTRFLSFSETESLLLPLPAQDVMHTLRDAVSTPSVAPLKADDAPLFLPEPMPTWQAEQSGPHNLTVTETKWPAAKHWTRVTYDVQPDACGCRLRARFEAKNCRPIALWIFWTRHPVRSMLRAIEANLGGAASQPATALTASQI